MLRRVSGTSASTAHERAGNSAAAISAADQPPR
jgi:hypothetical protein